MVEIVMSSEKGSVADIISIENMALLLFITFKRLKLALDTSCFLWRENIRWQCRVVVNLLECQNEHKSCNEYNRVSIIDGARLL